MTPTTCSCLAPPIGFIIFFKLMKICNINSYYLLVQMVDIFPYFPHFMEELKKKNISKTRGQKGLMLKLHSIYINIYKYILKYQFFSLGAKMFILFKIK